MPTPPPDDFLALQQALAGRYSLVRELGRGGMGVVYLAQEVALDRPVALKLLPRHLASQAPLRERFLLEARTAARLSHPNIVPIYTVEQLGELVYFAMAFVDGETLGERIRARGPVPPADATRWLREVTWALGYAHALGVVHRDVKPDNILIEAATGRALVSDFGIAAVGRGTGNSATGGDSAPTGLTAGIIGTPEFMSPEQAAGEPLDGRSDLYALGCVGYYMLSGRLPFEAPTVSAVIAKQITQPAQPLGAVAPETPARLAKAIDRCLAKEPDERFPTGEALADALAQGAVVRKEMPIPLRVFLSRSRESYQGTLAAAVVGVIFVPGLMSAVLVGSPVGVLTNALLVGGLITAPLTTLLYQARKLRKAGYGLDDLRLAVRDDLARREEEIRFEFGTEPTRLYKIAKPTMWASLTVCVGAVVGQISHLLPGFQLLDAMVAAGVGFIATGVYVSRHDSKRKDVWGKRALKFWQSKIGGWLHALAVRGVKSRALPTGVTHRPTELAIGLAADRLFDDLPKAVRADLRDLPKVVRRLEADAQAVRARVDELTNLLAEVGAPRPGAAADRNAELRQRLEQERATAEARLRDAVTALETVRLNLLRLHAGVGTVASVTADLSAAREVSEAVARLAQGHQEVDAVLARRTTGG